MIPRRLVLLLLMLAAWLGVTPAFAQDTGAEHSVKPDANVEVRLRDGSIQVRGWNQAKLKVEGPGAAQARVRVQAGGETVRVDQRNGSAETLLSVPEGASLNVQSVSGSVHVERVNGGLQARTVSGAVRVEGAGQDVIIRSVNGTVVVRRAANVRVRTVSSGIEVDGATGSVEVNSVSGPVTVRHANSVHTTISTTSGRVVFDGTMRPGPHEITSHGGSITLTVSKASSLIIQASALGGRVDNRTGAKEERHGSTVVVKLGQGAAQVDISALGGNIVLATR